MVDEPDSVVLILLRRMDAKVDRVLEDLADVKVRVTNIEENQAILMRRMDRFESRLERIERRFDLADA
ncbi:MAG TPA: hypothetical protein DHW63_12405 [Hyphomonadaceae bacterium]|nr:hypothetical protein [Hyphomonadaceae bacterium]